MLSTKLTETIVQASKLSHGTRYLHHGGGKSRRAVGCMQDMETLDLGQTLNVLRSESRPVIIYFPREHSEKTKAEGTFSLSSKTAVPTRKELSTFTWCFLFGFERSVV